MNNENASVPSLENGGNEVGKPFSFSATQNKVIQAYKAAGCNISQACEKANISRTWFYELLKEPEFKAEIESINEADLDFAESQLQFLIRGQYTLIHKTDLQGNPIPGEYEKDANGEPLRHYHIPIDNASVMFKLKTQGKKRGYVYRQEITGAEGSAIGGYEIHISRKQKDGK